MMTALNLMQNNIPFKIYADNFPKSNFQENMITSQIAGGLFYPVNI